jgi:hypothetical protein
VNEQRCTSARQVGTYSGIPVALRCDREAGHRGVHTSTATDGTGTAHPFQWPGDTTRGV